MKRTLRSLAVLGTVAALALTASGCAQGEKQLTIAFVMGAESDPFFQAMKVGATEEAAAQNVKLVWQGDPSHYDVATQVPIVDSVISTKPDGLVLIPTDPAGLQASSDKAVEAGIVVANVDTHTEDTSKAVIFITGDNADGGAKAADAIANAIGYTDGETYQVVVGLTSATATTNVGRLDGFKAQVAASYPGIEIVDVAYSQSNPQTAASNVSNWLTKFPNLKGIFAIDGTNASGAAAALQAKNLVGKIALVGYDAYPANVALIKSGVFTALIAQDPAAEARLAVKTIVANIKKGTKPAKKQVVIPNVALTSATSAADLAKYTYKTN
jgi:ABC-type sugar transport system substrate-binding protein